MPDPGVDPLTESGETRDADIDADGRWKWRGSDDPLTESDYREWYEEWWLWELPGRAEADVRYDRMYDWRLTDA